MLASGFRGVLLLLLRGVCVAFVRMQWNLELGGCDRFDLSEYQMKTPSFFDFRDPRRPDVGVDCS